MSITNHPEEQPTWSEPGRSSTQVAGPFTAPNQPESSAATTSRERGLSFGKWITSLGSPGVLFLFASIP